MTKEIEAINNSEGAGIQNIIIKNFRGFDKIEISNFSKINILVGKNSCGKTSVLEAIFLSLKPYGSSFAELYGARGLLNNNFLLPQQKQQGVTGVEDSKANNVQIQTFFSAPKWKDLFRMIRIGAEKSSNTEIEGSGNFKFPLTRKVLIKPYPFSSTKLLQNKDSFEFLQKAQSDFDANFFYVTSVDKVENKEIYTVSGVKRSDIFPNSADFGEVQFLDSEARKSKFAVIDYPNFKTFYYTANITNSYSHAKEHFQKIKKTEYELEITNMIKEVDKRVDGFEFDSEGEIRVRFSGQEGDLPFGLMGDGVKKAFSILCTMSYCKDGVLLIDEVENGLHYSSQKIFWDVVIKAAKQFNVQIFVTTHSYELIEALEESAKKTDDHDLVKLYRIGNDRVVEYDSRVIPYSLEQGREVRDE